jgi:hypothetical protein
VATRWSARSKSVRNLLILKHKLQKKKKGRDLCVTHNKIGKKKKGMNPTGICRGRGTDGRVLLQPGDAIPPAGCFTRRSLQIYIHGTVPPPTADETETESEPEDRAETESDHSIRPETEREQEDRDEIESDHFIQASPHEATILGGPPGDSHYS